MNFIKEFLRKDIAKKFLVLIIIAFFFFLLKSMLNLFLLTFLFTYISYSLQSWISKRVNKFAKINPQIITLFLYLLMSCTIVFIILKYIPIIIRQLGEIGSEISKFDYNAISKEFISTYITPHFGNVDLVSIFKDIDVTQYFNFDQVIRYASNLGTFGFNIFAGLILSLFFMLEKDKIKNFFSGFENSNLSVIYRYTKDFGINFLNSFGKVIQAQIIIAFVNSVLSTISLLILGFPQVLGLGVMIFLFSLVPVAGTIVSLIPLCIIAYTVGGFKTIIYVLVLITVLHALESYVLNPRFMADKTDLPVFIVFITLLVSEHFMGIWGLLLGVPLLIFILDLLNVKPTHKSRELKKKPKEN